jgi:hypothetical protein
MDRTRSRVSRKSVRVAGSVEALRLQIDQAEITCKLFLTR